MLGLTTTVPPTVGPYWCLAAKWSSSKSHHNIFLQPVLEPTILSYSSESSAWGKDLHTGCLFGKWFQRLATGGLGREAAKERKTLRDLTIKLATLLMSDAWICVGQEQPHGHEIPWNSGLYMCECPACSHKCPTCQCQSTPRTGSKSSLFKLSHWHNMGEVSLGHCGVMGSDNDSRKLGWEGWEMLRSSYPDH